MSNLLDHLGKGIRYPFVRSGTGDLTKARYLDAVVSSVNRILDTPMGTMPMNREFGTKIHALLFESNEALIRHAAAMYIKEPIKKFEPRISDVEVYVYFLEDGQMDAVTKYTAVYGKAVILNIAYTVRKYQVIQVIRRPYQLGV